MPILFNQFYTAGMQLPFSLYVHRFPCLALLRHFTRSEIFFVCAPGMAQFVVAQVPCGPSREVTTSLAKGAYRVGSI
jgi:hypothetical protein